MPPCSLRVTCSTPEGYSSKEPLSFSVLILTSKMIDSLQQEFNLYPRPTRTNVREFINSFPFMSSMIVEHTQSTLSSVKTKFMRDNKEVTFTPSIFCEEGVGSSSSSLTLSIEKAELIEVAANELKIFRTPFQFVEDHQSTLFKYFKSQLVKTIRTAEELEAAQAQLDAERRALEERQSHDRHQSAREAASHAVS